MNLIEQKIIPFLSKIKIPIYNISKITEEGSHRNYYRIHSEKNFVICVTYPFLEEDDFIQLSKYLLKKKAKIPKLIDFSPKEGLILLEDGGDKYLQDTILDLKLKKNYKKIINIYKEIIDELIKWQKFQDVPEFVKKRYFDKQKLNFEIDFFLERLRIQKIKINEFEFKMFLYEVNDFLSDPKHIYVFTHRDFHSRNILIKNKQFFIIDYQDARMGLYWYDLSSLLFDPYVELNFSTIDILYEYYCKNFFLDKEKHREIFYLQALQRLTKALGSFFFLGYEKNKTHFLKYILPTLEILIKLHSIGKFPDSVYLFFIKLYERFKNS